MAIESCVVDGKKDAKAVVAIDSVARSAIDSD